MTDSSRNSSTGIRLLPPVVYGVAIALGLLLERLWPSMNLAWVWRASLSTPLFVASTLLILWTLMQFRRERTPFDVRKEATSLITDGPFRYSRNPGYVALTMLYLAIGLVLSSLWLLGLSIPILVFVDLAIIRKEESNLVAAFETQYQEYQRGVRRWL